MSQISPQKLLKRFQSSPNMKYIMESLSQSKIKVSKQVYNLQTRNIKLFIRQQKEMEMKRKEEKSLTNNQSSQNKKYDQNQLLQLQYKLKLNQQQPLHIEKCKSQPSEIPSNSDRRNYKLKGMTKPNASGNLQLLETSKIFLNRPKRVSYIQPLPLHRPRNETSQNLPRITIRKKSKSTFQELNTKFGQKQIDIGSKIRLSSLQQRDLSLKKSSSSIMEYSNKLLQKKNISIIQKSNQKFIEITDDKMTRYIKSLHMIVNGFYQFGRSLDQQKANSLIFQRYSLQRKVFLSQPDQSLDSQSSQRKFQLPYMEFISQSETRKSIHRIINMTVRNTQKVVFKLLDFNRNGFIDQKDLVDMVQLSEKIPDLKHDLLKITRYVGKDDNFSISNVKSMSYREDSQRQIEVIKEIPIRYQSIQTPKKSEKSFKFLNIIKSDIVKQRSHTYSTSQTTEMISSRKIKNDQSITTSLPKQRLYSLLETKQKFFNSKLNKDQFKLTVTLQDFHKIFGNQRPSAFHDLIKFLFNVKKEDLINQQYDEVNENSKIERKPVFKKRQASSGFKNYDIPEIIKDMERKFQCDIEMQRYNQVLHIENIQERNSHK